ncbi:MAG: hotdog fold thioesterase [Myxococcales bacterium]|nr:hotdog fold thioesterase [Myxococcales bacterium]
MTDADAKQPDRAQLIQFFEEGIPFNKHLGVRVTHLDERRAVLSMATKPEHIGDVQRPALHGGITAALADAAGGLVCFSALTNPRDRVSTIDLRIDYLRPGTPGEDLHCEATLVRMGNRVGVARVLVFSGPRPPLDDPERHDRAIATAQAAYNVLRR